MDRATADVSAERVAQTQSPESPSRFAVRSVFWRRCIDWIIVHTPALLHPPLVDFSTLVFFFRAGPARRTILQNLKVILPGSWRLTNYLRTFRVFRNFAWALTDAAVYRLRTRTFRYELRGEEILREIATARGGIVLTAHLGNYDLGASIFAEKFQRQLRIIRAPEPDTEAARHLDRSITESAAGAVKVDYNTDSASLSFDLLNALRAGEMVSIQGDRVVGNVAVAPVKLFGREVSLPTGPFVLALASQKPIYPLFMVRCGFRKYRIVALAPIICRRSDAPRDEEIAAAMQKWADILQEMIATYWPQWFAFTPVF